MTGMHAKTSSAYLYAAGLGALSGARSLAAPAFLSRRLRNAPTPAAGGKVERLLSSEAGHRLITALAATELLIDKVPGIPARIGPPSLASRALWGGVAGAVIAHREGGSGPVGALIGAATAIGAAYATFHARRAAVQLAGVPDTVAALVEDALVVSAGAALVRVRR